jgi:hypothetical protein
MYEHFAVIGITLVVITSIALRAFAEAVRAKRKLRKLEAEREEMLRLQHEWWSNPKPIVRLREK